MKNKILIVDFGSQYTKLIAKKVKSFGISLDISLPKEISKQTNLEQYKGIILSGGPDSVYQKNSLTVDSSMFNNNIPVLGICYGMQLITQMFGGKVESSNKKEFGKAVLNIIKPNDLFAGIKNNPTVWMSHSDHITEIPKNFVINATSSNSVCAISKDNIYGLQFHPEVDNTEISDEIFHNFFFKICKFLYDPKHILLPEDRIPEIKGKIGNHKVCLALSGGVDSLVVAVLLHRAIKENLHCFYVDNGLLRNCEAYDTINYLKKEFKMNIKVIHAKELFLNELKGISDPETKRKIVGKLFIDLFAKEMETFDKEDFLAQGTIASDIIESSKGSSNSKNIKSHHNVGGLPDNFNLKLIEPVKDLFKDEVRKLGLNLGIKKEFISRQPMPGPGYVVRIIGDVTPENLDIIQKADKIFIEELKSHNLYDKTDQSFAIFLPIKTVGVMGDFRTYSYVIAIRSIQTKDFMTGTVSHLPWDFLEKVAAKIINEVEHVNRVVYDITSKPPGTIEWE